MDKIADYRGTLLNHVETLYRPGERALAIRLVTALGCTVTDTGFTGDGDETFLAVHPNPADPDIRSNAFFMSPMRPEQQAVEARLLRLSRSDPAFAAELADYRQAAQTKPFGVAHFALRYSSNEALEQAAAAVERECAAELGDRVNLRVFRQGDADGAVGIVTQGFIHQDVIVSGSFLYGQVIELQGPPPRN